MEMKSGRNWLMATGILLSVFIALTCYAAYTHNGDTDSQHFRNVYPQAVGTKLDSCALCHKGGDVTSGGKTTTYGNCQYCHAVTNYGKGIGVPPNNTPPDFLLTLNQYVLAYFNNGRSAAAITAIDDLDSDGDGYPSKAEIAALTYPGDPKDDPSLVPAPSKVFTRKQIESMPQHSQFLLMNASKSTDFYGQYTGVTVERLLKSLKLSSATGVTVFSPDGFSQYHPFQADSDPGHYNVYGTYPAATFYYNSQADFGINPSTGWCDYHAATGRNNGDPIVNPDGLKLLLAIKRDGQYLDPGVLGADNKLGGEGPFRVVPPQKVVGPPDQRSTVTSGTWVWPYDSKADHNAGFSSRSVTMIRVEPLPAGTTDINTLEAGWPYIDEDKIVVYGAINPLDNIKDQLTKLIADVNALSRKEFQIPLEKAALEWKLEMARWLVAVGLHGWAYRELEQVIQKMDGCKNSGHPDRCDWLRNCDTQATLYWAVNDVMVLLKILE